MEVSLIVLERFVWDFRAQQTLTIVMSWISIRYRFLPMSIGRVVCVCYLKKGGTVCTKQIWCQWFWSLRVGWTDRTGASDSPREIWKGWGWAAISGLVPYFGGQFWPIYGQEEEEFFATMFWSLFDEKSLNQFYIHLCVQILNLLFCLFLKIFSKDILLYTSKKYIPHIQVNAGVTDNGGR